VRLHALAFFCTHHLIFHNHLIFLDFF